MINLDRLTDNQRLFVTERNGNILVSASAGSGKTSTMIEKLADLILNGCSAKNLLVLTYTNASASEMKLRLFRKLSECLAEEENDEKKDYISSQIDLLNNSDIGTVHSVCKKILMNYFYAIDIDPSFSIITGKEQEFLLNTAIDNVFNKLISENDENFYSIYSLYNNKRNTNEIKRLVKRVYEFSLSKVDYSVWKKNVLDDYDVENIDDNSSAKFLVDYFKAEAKQLLAKLKELLIANSDILEKYSEYVKILISQIEYIGMQDSYSNMCKIVPTLSLGSKPRVNNKNVDEGEYNERLMSVKEKLDDLFKTMKKIFVPYSGEDMKNSRIVVENVFWLKELVEEEYHKQKHFRNQIDFSDLEHLTLKVLENEKIRNELKEKYAYIFVDEYQDINQVQEIIIQKISNNNVNMIGDLKQAIYHFRLSSPEIFVEKYSRFSEGKGGKVIDLNHNFRSEPNILEFANYIFNVLMTKETIGMDYKTTSQLQSGLKKDNVCVVDVDLINTQNEKGDESELIARKVAKLVEEGYAYSDIAVLFRSRAESVPLVEKLKIFNIPCDASYKTKLFKNNEILVLYSLLKVIENDNDDLALATTLKSDFFGLNENDLAFIRENHEEGDFCEAVKAYLENYDDLISQKIRTLFDFVDRCRFNLNHLTLSQLMQNIFVEFGVMEHYLAFCDGTERVANINYFVNLISNDEYKYNLKKCLDYLDSLKSEDIEVETTGGANSVKIMTIHASKGLEFPAVVIGGFGKNFNLRENTSSIVINDNLGVGVKVLDASGRTMRNGLVENACKIQNKIDDLNEEIRLLYVALTRAKSRLCIVGSAKENTLKEKYDSTIYSCRNYFEYMFKAITRGDLNRINDQPIVIKMGEGEFRFNVISPSVLLSENIETKPILFGEGNKELAKKIEKYYEYNYPYPLTNIAFKNTVSSILKEEVDYENKVENLKNISSQISAISDFSLQLGTAYHSTMQNLNYSESKAEIEELVARIKTNELPFEMVNPDKILRAIKTISKLFKDGYKLRKEAQFTMRLNYSEIDPKVSGANVIVQGVIDLVIENPDETIIVDFKTNKVSSGEALKDMYALQLNMYSKAYEKAFKKQNIKKYLYSFELDKLIEV